MYYLLYYSPDESAPPTGGSPLSLNSLLEDELPAPKLLCRLLFSTAVPVVSFVLLVSVVCWLELIWAENQKNCNMKSRLLCKQHRKFRPH